MKKEILFQQDLERLIGKRPFEIKHPAIAESEPIETAEETEKETEAKKEESPRLGNTGRIEPRIA